MQQKRIFVYIYSARLSIPVIFAAIAVLSCFSDIEVLPEKYEDFLAMHSSSSSIALVTSSGSSSSSSWQSSSSGGSSSSALQGTSSDGSSSSSSSLSPEMAFCRLPNDVCTLVSLETCGTFGGTPDQSCAESSSSVLSSSSVEPPSSSSNGGLSSSSSSLPSGTAICKLPTGACTPPISLEACEAFGGTPDQSCGGSGEKE